MGQTVLAVYKYRRKELNLRAVQKCLARLKTQRCSGLFDLAQDLRCRKQAHSTQVLLKCRIL